jgi:hypothetical protein
MRRIHTPPHYVIKINFNIISHSSYTSEVGYSFRIPPPPQIYVVFHMYQACTFIHSGNNSNNNNNNKPIYVAIPADRNVVKKEA